MEESMQGGAEGTQRGERKGPRDPRRVGERDEGVSERGEGLRVPHIQWLWGCQEGSRVRFPERRKEVGRKRKVPSVVT